MTHSVTLDKMFFRCPVYWQKMITSIQSEFKLSNWDDVPVDIINQELAKFNAFYANYQIVFDNKSDMLLYILTWS